MGLYLRKELKNGAEISVWEVTESEEELLKIISIPNEELEDLHYREVPLGALNVNANLLCRMGNDCHKSVCMGNAYLGKAVLDERCAIVVMAKIYLLLKDCVQQCSYSKFLASSCSTLCNVQLLQLLVRDRNDFQ